MRDAWSERGCLIGRQRSFVGLHENPDATPHHSRALRVHCFLRKSLGGGFAEGRNGSFPVRCHDVGHFKPRSGPVWMGTRTGLALASPFPAPSPQVRSDPDARRRPPVPSSAPAFRGVHPTCCVLSYPCREPPCRGLLGGTHRTRPTGVLPVSRAGGADGSGRRGRATGASIGNPTKV